MLIVILYLYLALFTCHLLEFWSIPILKSSFFAILYGIFLPLILLHLSPKGFYLACNLLGVSSSSTAKLGFKVPKETTIYGLEQGVLNLVRPNLWMNMGYWKNTQDFQVACKALVSMVAETAHFKSGDTILDVGYGCGDQDIYLQEEYKLSKIVGFTLEPVQQVVAKQKVSELKLDETIQLELGDAAQISTLLASKGLPTTYDRVISIDSAYHYNTRASFLQQSFDHLRSGGSIGLADIILARKPHTWLGQTVLKLICSASEIPYENMVSEVEYREMLERLGYTEITLVPIDEDVFPRLADFIDRQEHIFDGLVASTIWMKLSVMKHLLRFVYHKHWLHFVIVSGKKV
ncbi:hypothetical protein K7432_004915 [Basidiobolus ranarum]|uniref:phosphoethanolamine N-methyltransferase n=1 Tax=Basidiobolus ranarum TaxID=34480 RepID=A0ABR2W442_9FUNG